MEQLKYNRAFFYTINYKRNWFFKKPVSITISDGFNNIIIELHEYFTLNTNIEFPEQILIRGN